MQMESEAELLQVAAEMKNALGVSKGNANPAERTRTPAGYHEPIAKARLLSLAEYSAAQGDPSTPLTGGDPSVDKVAASGRSASLLNMDWMVRHCAAGGGPRYPPPFGNLDSHDTSDQAMVDREVRHAGVAVREQQLEQEKKRKEGMLKKIWIFMNRASDREQNVRYQRLRLAFAHFKARAEVRVYLRHPARRLQSRQREQQRARRQNPRRVHFAGALSADIRVLTPVAPWCSYQGPLIRVQRSGFYVTELDMPDPNVIWHTPAQTKFSVHKLMDLPLTVKRIPIDEVESKMEYEEHWQLQHYGGGTDNAWRRALMIAGGVEETAERAIWNEPDHHMLRLARRKGVVKLLLDRDIKHVISEGIFPDTHHPDESPYVTEVREMRDTGEDGVRRMRGLLDEDEMTLFKEYILDTTGLTHPGWISDSLFRMWKEHRGVWRHTVGPTEQGRTVTVTYGEWRDALTDTGLPFTDGHRGSCRYAPGMPRPGVSK